MTKVTMFDFSTGDELFSQILMLRNVSKKSFLILEGESDCRTLDQHINDASCETIPGLSKENVIEAVRLADEQGIPGVAGLIDRDWIGFGEEAPNVDGIFITDLYDLESTVFYSTGIVERFFAAHTDKEARTAYLGRSGAPTILDLLTRLAFPVGFLRLLSFNHHYALSMRHFPAHVPVRADFFWSDTDILIATAFGRSAPLSEPDKKKVIEQLEQGISDIPASKEYCCGHDLASILMHILAKRFHKRMSIDVLLGSIRALFGREHLNATKFYMEMSSWAAAKGMIIWSASAS